MTSGSSRAVGHALPIWRRDRSAPSYDILLNAALSSLIASTIADQFIITDGAGAVCLWRASLGQMERTLIRDAAGAPIFSRDGRSVLVERIVDEARKRFFIPIDLDHRDTVERIRLIQSQWNLLLRVCLSWRYQELLNNPELPQE